MRFIQIDPETVQVTLDSLISRKFPVELVVNGDPPLGYRKGIPTVSPEQVIVSGPETQVVKVAHVRTTLDISGQRETKEITLPVEAVSETGDVIDNVTINPKTVKVTMPISLEGGYKNVVVKVVTQGQVPAGYRLTNISVTPPNVTIFSADPVLVNNIPGYVETKPLSLNGLKEDTDFRLGLNLPNGVTLVGEQSVLVQVGVAPIEGSLTVNLPVETLGLPPNLAALISPATVDVIVTGPLPVLDTLTADSFRVLVDLTGLEQGVYQIKPVIDLAPDQVSIVSILPETVEVTIEPAPTATPTLTPGRATPSRSTLPPARQPLAPLPSRPFHPLALLHLKAAPKESRCQNQSLHWSEGQTSERARYFNRLAEERLAVVDDVPGTTRDRLVAEAEWNGVVFDIVDTGGIDPIQTGPGRSQQPLSIGSADFVAEIRTPGRDCHPRSGRCLVHHRRRKRRHPCRSGSSPNLAPSPARTGWRTLAAGFVGGQ